MSDETPVITVPIHITAPLTILQMAVDISALAALHQRLGRYESADWLEGLARLIRAAGHHRQTNAENVTRDVLESWSRTLDDPAERDRELES